MSSDDNVKKVHNPIADNGIVDPALSTEELKGKEKMSERVGDRALETDQHIPGTTPTEPTLEGKTSGRAEAAFNSSIEARANKESIPAGSSADLTIRKSLDRFAVWLNEEDVAGKDQTLDLIKRYLEEN